MIIVIGKVEASQGNNERVLGISLEHVKRSRKESGCIEHDVSVDPEDNSKFIFVEYWADMPALLTHFSLEASKGFVTALTPLLAKAPDMKIYDTKEITTRES